MRHADDDTRAALAGQREEASARVLLQHVVDDLQRVQATHTQRFVAMLGATDRRSQGGAVRSDRARVAQAVELREQVIPHNRVHAGIVELVEIYVVGPQPAQTLLQGAPQKRRREVLRQLALATARAGVCIEVVPKLGGDHHVAATAGESLPDKLLALAVAIRVAGVKERNAEIKRAVQQPLRRGVVAVSPPARANRPAPKADLGDLYARVSDDAIAHACSPCSRDQRGARTAPYGPHRTACRAPCVTLPSLV